MLPQQQRGLHGRALHISKHMLRAEVLLMPFWALYDGDLESWGWAHWSPCIFSSIGSAHSFCANALSGTKPR